MKKLPFLIATLGALLLSSAARADSEIERKARAMFAEGNRRLDAGDFAGALEQYRSAYALYPNVKILMNIGTMLRQLGRNAEAANAYSAYLRDQEADPARKAEVAKLLGELDHRVAILSLRVRDSGTQVLIDGQSVGKPGRTIAVRVEPGTHTIVGQRDGEEPVKVTVTVAAHEAKVVTLASPDDTSPAAVPEPIVSEPSAPAAVSGAPARDAARPVAPTLSHRGQLNGIARADIEGQGRGVAAAIGLSYGVGDHVELGVAALVGKEQGAEPGGTVLLLRGTFKPIVSVGVPIFFVDGARPGVRGGAGLEWDPSRDFGVSVQAGVAVFPGAPEGYESVVFVPSVGIHPRMF
jgi:hypothetical protein